MTVNYTFFDFRGLDKELCDERLEELLEPILPGCRWSVIREVYLEEYTESDPKQERISSFSEELGIEESKINIMIEDSFKRINAAIDDKTINKKEFVEICETLGYVDFLIDLLGYDYEEIV